MSKLNDEQSANLNGSLKNVSKAFNSLRMSLGGAADSDKSSIDRKIEKAIGSLSYSFINKDKFDYTNHIKDTLSNNVSSDFKVFKDTQTVGGSLIESFENKSRFSRYANADEVCNSITYCSRALKVLRDSIISPDNITKAILQFMVEKDLNSDEIEEIIRDIKKINSTLDIEDKIPEIIENSLKYGDKFVEICDYRSEEIPISQSLMIMESKSTNSKKSKKEAKLKEFFNVKVTDVFLKESVSKKNPREIIVTGFEEKENVRRIKVSIVEDIVEDPERPSDYLVESKVDEILNEELIVHKSSNKKKDDENDEKVINLENVKFIFHDASSVIKLQSEKFKMNLGYLVIPLNYRKYSASGILGGTGVMSSTGILGGGGGSGRYFGSTVMSGIDEIYLQIIKMVKKYVSQNVEMRVEEKDELVELLTRAIKDVSEQGGYVGSNSAELKIRYVPPERMQHFHENDSVFFPYGEGIFEKIMNDAKMYIALKTALVVRRVADSSDKRVINVEMNMPRNLKNSIESLKEALQKRKFSLNGSDIGTIPTMITSYEDYIIPVNKGKKYIEFDTITPTTNIRDNTEELNNFRDDIVSGLGVPPALLGIEAQNFKSTLSHESSMFAETILSWQTYYSKQLTALFSKIYKLVYNKVMPKPIMVTLSPPKMLFAEREAEHMEVVSRIMDTLENMGVPKEYSRKQYTNFDWEKATEAEADEIIQRRGKPSRPKKDTMGMGM